MTSARERLAMLHSHIKDNSDVKLLSEFPLLVKSERQQYLNSSFQSVPGSSNSSYFAPSVIRETNIPVIPITPPTSIGNISRCDTQHDHIESSIPGFPPTMTKTLSNLEFDKLCSNVNEKLRMMVGSNKLGDSSHILSGSESLGWEFLGSNLVQSLEDGMLCISTGFYSNKFAEYLQKYVVSDDRNVTVLEANLGDTVPLELIRNELTKKVYGIITLIHTDNSTGIVTDIEKISQMVKQVSPNTLIAVDAVYSAGIEEIQFDNWGIDFTLSTYQNTGFNSDILSFILLSSRALIRMPEANLNSSSVSTSCEMQLSYSKTNFQLLNALNLSFQRLLGINDQHDILIDSSSKLPTKLLSRFSDYKLASERLRKRLVNEGTGITTVSQDWSNCSNGITALYLPETIEKSELLETLSKECDLSVANGTHPRIASEYISLEHAGFRFPVNDIDIDKVVEIIKMSSTNTK